MEKYSFGRSVADEAVAQFRGRIKGYQGYLDRFDEQAEVYFFSGKEKNKKTVKTIRIRNFATGVEVEVGRAKVRREGRLDEATFNQFRLYTVWFLTHSEDPRLNRGYEVGDEDGAREQVEKALVTLDEYLETHGG